MGKTSLQQFASTTVLRYNVLLNWSLPLFLFVALVFFLLSPLATHAVDTAAVPAPATSSSSIPWNNLTPVQKQALAPLEKDWVALGKERQQKWVVFAAKYQQMNPDDQKRIQEKMNAWAKLTPEQRLAARENYIRSNQLQPEQRKQKWDEYRQLPDDQKAQLANHTDKKKIITNLPTPAESKVQKLQPLKKPNKPVTSGGATSVAPASSPASPPVAAPNTALSTTPPAVAAPTVTPAPSNVPAPLPPSAPASTAN